MSEPDPVTDEFERYRSHLRAVAYRMLGSVSEAEDAVQESWLRLTRSDAESIANLRAWLTTVVARVALDMLRARNSRREDYFGTWLPEPIVSFAEDPSGADPEYEALLADSVGLAMLVVLEQLAPPERLAYVLHDMFAVPFEEIAPVVGRTPAAARQLASRARRRIQGDAAPPEADPAQQRELVEAFLAASRAGDFDALLAVLHPDVVLRADTGGSRERARPTFAGAEAVAGQALGFGRHFVRFGRVALVNGVPGIVIAPGPRALAVAAFTVDEGRIVAIDVVADPAKLRGLAVDA
ncbi:MAG TPA: RNA polymerase sigma factor SigJ [Solirubrobacteraceae bacterium]|jgi:RNA polymerase sigma-70 factor (ECF subfamily)|nr:RNA polymerase sigma factor SigJ [Solirubrobacteraceae bacterium]